MSSVSVPTQAGRPFTYDDLAAMPDDGYRREIPVELSPAELIAWA